MWRSDCTSFFNSARDFSTAGAGETCERDLASEKGYVILDAAALESAARRNVRRAPGSSRLERGRSRFSDSKKKNVREGLSVRTRLAEYPPQKPWMPLSLRMRFAISCTEVALREVWARVAMLDRGVVNSLLKAPAAAPTASSSRVLSLWLLCASRRRVRM